MPWRFGPMFRKSAGALPMHRQAARRLSSLGIYLLSAVLGFGSNPAGAADPPTLDDLVSNRLKLADLAWPINAKSAYWPGENYRPFELHTIATLERDGVLSKA